MVFSSTFRYPATSLTLIAGRALDGRGAFLRGAFMGRPVQNSPGSSSPGRLPSLSSSGRHRRRVGRDFSALSAALAKPVQPSRAKGAIWVKLWCDPADILIKADRGDQNGT